jgi:hypothetical protein
VDSIVQDVARERRKVDGVDYVNLGYKAGNEAVMVLMGQSLPTTFPRDHAGRDVRRLPVMRGVRDYSSFALLVSISAGYPGTKEYVQQVQGRFHIPIVAGVTAVFAPTLYPYLQSGQLRGLLGGMAGAAEYEELRYERGLASRGSLHPSLDPSVWVAALLTLCIFSFLYRDNPFYRFAEHLFVGVSAGYYLVLSFWTVLVANLWDPLAAVFGPPHVPPLAARLGDYRAFLLVPALLGLLLFTRFLRRGGWLARWSLAVVIGVYAGLKTTGFAQGDFVAQVHGSIQPLWTGSLGTSVNVWVFTVGLVSSLLFFFFSREQKGALGAASRVGVAFLMVSFGAGYGYTVMSRISLLIGRLQFLLFGWLGIG